MDKPSEQKAEPKPRFSTLKEVCDRLHKGRGWMDAFLKIHPYYRKAGRTKLFSEEHIVQLWDAMERPPEPRVLPRVRRRSWRPPSSQPTDEEALAKIEEMIMKEKAERREQREKQRAIEREYQRSHPAVDRAKRRHTFEMDSAGVCVLFDGLKIARLGPQDPISRKSSWTALEPGWDVVWENNDVTITRNGASVY
jgi:hypothetical protein